MDKRQKSWSLTALAAEFDIPFKTAMSYRNGYVKIAPDVKVPGVSKKQFSPRQVAKFLIARRLFAARIVGSVVQKFFSEVIDEHYSHDEMFEESAFKDFPPAEFVTEELVTGFYRQSMPEEMAVNQAKLILARMKVAEGYEKMLRVTWLIAYDPEHPETPYFLILDNEPMERRKELIDIVSREWRWALLCLGAVKDELWGRVKANYECMDYKPKTAGEQVKMALSGWKKAQEKVSQ